MQTKRFSVAAFLTAILTMVLMQGCNTSRQVTRNDLEGQQWVLKTLNGKDARSLFERDLPTLKFDFKEKIVSGSGGCNSYTGRFVMVNNMLSTPNIASTRRMCMFPNAENEFFATFGKENTLMIKADTLRFQKGKEVVMEFERVQMSSSAITPEQLTGKWQLTKIGNQAAAEIFTGVAAKVPDMTLDNENHKITGMSGCNRFNTSYTINGNTINISPAATTRMACPNLQGETLFLQEFRGELQISVPDSKTLKLIRGTEVVLEFEKVDGFSRIV